MSAPSNVSARKKIFEVRCFYKGYSNHFAALLHMYSRVDQWLCKSVVHARLPLFIKFVVFFTRDYCHLYCSGFKAHSIDFVLFCSCDDIIHYIAQGCVALVPSFSCQVSNAALP